MATDMLPEHVNDEPEFKCELKNQLFLSFELTD
jgi:hypothetical protein